MKFVGKKLSKGHKWIIPQKETGQIHIAEHMCTSDYIKIFHPINPEIVIEENER